jgi:hypothetical protein
VTGLAAALVVALSMAQNAAPLRPAEEHAVTAVVQRQVRRIVTSQDPTVEEVPGFREIARDDLDGDGQRDLVVMFTVERGNSWLRFLTAFSGPKLEPIETVRVGEKGQRSARLESVARGRVQIATMSYGPSDPMCCPSVAGHSTYVVRAGTLVEERPKAIKSSR